MKAIKYIHILGEIPVLNSGQCNVKFALVTRRTPFIAIKQIFALG
jgi:hypothetical protein